MRVIYLLLLSIASLPVFAVTLEQLQQQGHLVINYRFSPREQVIQYQPVTIEIEVATDRWFARGVRIDDLDIEGAVINHQGNLSTNSSRQPDSHIDHICTASLLCEFSYVVSDDLVGQTDSHTDRISKAFLLCDNQHVI